MSQEKDTEDAREVGMGTERDPIVLAAAGSVLLAWYQFYIRGNKEAGLFIGLWPPTMLAFSNAIRINNIDQKMESSAMNFLERLMQNR